MSTYSFLDTQATFTGLTGSISLGNGAAVAEEGISIALKEDKNLQTVGADGEVMNTLRAGKSGQITVRLLKTSPVNAKLMLQYAAQSQSSQLWGNNVVTISQTGVGDLHVGRGCAFSKQPEMHYKKDGDIVEWVFDAGKIDSILGTY